MEDSWNVVERLKKMFEQKEIEKYGRLLTDEERAEKEKEQEKIMEAQKLEEKKERIRVEKQMTLGDFSRSVPLRYRNATFDNFVCSTERQKAIVEYLKQGKSAILYGSNGTGKTHLAYAYCFHQYYQGFFPRYILAFDFFNEIRRSFNDGKSEDVVRKYAMYDFLVIDEIDKTHGSQMEFTYLYSLINNRYNDMLPTVLITNAKPDEFATIVGTSVLDRIGSDGKIIELSGENYRQKLAKASGATLGISPEPCSKLFKELNFPTIIKKKRFNKVYHHETNYGQHSNQYKS